MALLLHFEYLHKCLFNVTWGLYRITFGALLGQRWAESTQRGRFHNPLPRLNIPVKFVDFRPLVFLKTGITYIQTDKIQRKSDPVLSYTRIFSIAYIYRKNFENSAAVRPYVPDQWPICQSFWNLKSAWRFSWKRLPKFYGPSSSRVLRTYDKNFKRFYLSIKGWARVPAGSAETGKSFENRFQGIHTPGYTRYPILAGIRRTGRYPVTLGTRVYRLTTRSTS